jgi:hypothetical protein
VTVDAVEGVVGFGAAFGDDEPPELHAEIANASAPTRTTILTTRDDEFTGQPPRTND